MLESIFQILPQGEAQRAGTALAKSIQTSPTEIAVVKAAVPQLREGIKRARQDGQIAAGLTTWLNSLKLTTSAAHRDATVRAVEQEQQKINKGLAPILGTLLMFL